MTPAPQHDRRFVLWLSLAQLITWGSIFYGFALFLEPAEHELGMSRSDSSLAFSLALLAEGFAAYQVGRWIDAGHERMVMTCSSMLAAACLFAHSLITTQAQFYAVWFGLGVALSGTLYTPVFAVVTRRFPADFRRAIITITFLGGLASTVMIPTTAGLISAFGWRHALWVLAALQLFLCAPLHAVQLRGAPKRIALPEAEVAPATAHLRSAPFLLIGVFSIGMLAVTAALPPHMISLLRGSGLPEYWVIAIPASVGVLQVFGRMILFFFEHHFDLHTTNRTVPTLIPIGLAFLIAGAGYAWAAVMFVLLFGLGNGMMTIVKGTAIAQYVSREHVASLNGALGVPSALGRALTPWLMGVLWSAQSGYTYGLWLLLAISIVSVAALIGAQNIALSRQRLGASSR
ncbi:MAG TPA: MFS transporter [Ramlibacter sp.]|nr:MFS transporter [Ramlibacter sp.]